MNSKLAYFPLLTLLTKITLSATIILTASSYAGGETHGGDAVVCFDRPYFLSEGKVDAQAKIIDQPRLLDFWEMEQLYDFELYDWKNILLQPTYEEILKHNISFIGRLDSHLYYYLKNQRKKLHEYFKFTYQTQLKQIHDSQTMIKPDASRNCYEIQLAIFQQTPISGQNISIVNATIFNLLSEEEKAALILHELLWKYIYSNLNQQYKNEKLSPYLRFYTYLLFSDQLMDKRFSSYSYMKFLVTSGLHFIFKPETRVYHIGSNSAQIKAPRRIRTLQDAPKIKDVQMRFINGFEFELPGDIWEPGQYKRIQPKKSFDYNTCISLEFNDLRNHGPCKS